MKRIFLTTIAAAAAFAAAPAAQAANFIPGDSQFVVSNGDNGTISARIGNTIKVGTVAAPVSFTDMYYFMVGQNGLGSGGLTTTTSLLNRSTNLDITSVDINGTMATLTKDAQGFVESASLIGLNLVAGATNILTVTGVARGNGSYGGDITFSPTAVPEAATWAMMLIGFGAMGVALRYRRRTTKVSFA